MSKEVELVDEGQEYEIVPMGPLRRLEKRIERIESSKSISGDEALIRDILDIMKANQKIVNDMVESTSQLRNAVSDLTSKINNVIDNMNEFMNLLREASEASIEEEVTGEIGKNIIDPIAEKIDEMSKSVGSMSKNIIDTNSQLVEGIDKLDKRLKRIYASQARTLLARK